jgi:chloramphenicol-sensitive protein RarD
VDRTRSGILAALAAFFLWGVLPIFWKALSFLAPASIVAQRTIWSLVLVLGILLWRDEWAVFRSALRSPKTLGWFLLSGCLLAGNWLLYVWSTLNNHVIEAALGYYLNPFFNMLLGAICFGDKNSRRQLLAITLAMAGVVLQVPAVGHFPWIALVLAGSFSLYALVRKLAPLDSLVGLATETSLLAPFALIWLMLSHTSPASAFGDTWGHAVLVMITGLATAVPLLFFSYAARTIRLTTLGILQFVGPTLQFLIGWKLYHEPMTTTRLLSFALIWLAVFIYASDSLRRPQLDSEK